MIRSLAILVGMASCHPAFAQQHESTVPEYQAPEVWYLNNDDAEPGEPFGWIVHRNMWTHAGLTEEIVSVDTPRGEITLRLERTSNIDCNPACPDTLEIWSMPADIIALPGFLVTPERETMRMDLYVYHGS